MLDILEALQALSVDMRTAISLAGPTCRQSLRRDVDAHCHALQQRSTGRLDPRIVEVCIDKPLHTDTVLCRHDQDQVLRRCAKAL